MFPSLRHLCTSTWWPCWRRKSTNSQTFRMFSLASDLNQKIARREPKRFGEVGKFTLNQIVIRVVGSIRRLSGRRNPEARMRLQIRPVACGNPYLFELSQTGGRSEEHTSELQSPVVISYAV